MQKQYDFAFPLGKIYPEKQPRYSIEKDIEIKQSTLPNGGLGVFTKNDIDDFEQIGIYTGKVISAEEAENSDSDYIFVRTYGKQNIYIDGNPNAGFGNWTGRINHDKEKANVKFGATGIISAISDISAGDELFVDYGDQVELIFARGKKREKKQKEASQSDDLNLSAELDKAVSEMSKKLINEDTGELVSTSQLFGSDDLTEDKQDRSKQKDEAESDDDEDTETWKFPLSVLTVQNPWGFAIVALGKDVENRKQNTMHRGPLLIKHSRFDRKKANETLELYKRGTSKFLKEIPNNLNDIYLKSNYQTTFGKVVGETNLKDVKNPNEVKSRWKMKDYKFSWILNHSTQYDNYLTCSSGNLTIVPVKFKDFEKFSDFEFFINNVIEQTDFQYKWMEYKNHIYDGRIFFEVKRLLEQELATSKGDLLDEKNNLSLKKYIFDQHQDVFTKLSEEYQNEWDESAEYKKALSSSVLNKDTKYKNQFKFIFRTWNRLTQLLELDDSPFTSAIDFVRKEKLSELKTKRKANKNTRETEVARGNEKESIISERRKSAESKAKKFNKKLEQKFKSENKSVQSKALKKSYNEPKPFAEIKKTSIDEESMSDKDLKAKELVKKTVEAMETRQNSIRKDEEIRLKRINAAAMEAIGAPTLFKKKSKPKNEYEFKEYDPLAEKNTELNLMNPSGKYQDIEKNAAIFKRPSDLPADNTDVYHRIKNILSLHTGDIDIKIDDPDDPINILKNVGLLDFYAQEKGPWKCEKEFGKNVPPGMLPFYSLHFNIRNQNEVIKYTNSDLPRIIKTVWLPHLETRDELVARKNIFADEKIPIIPFDYDKKYLWNENNIFDCIENEANGNCFFESVQDCCAMLIDFLGSNHPLYTRFSYIITGNVTQIRTLYYTWLCDQCERTDNDGYAGLFFRKFVRETKYSELLDDCAHIDQFHLIGMSYFLNINFQIIFSGRRDLGNVFDCAIMNRLLISPWPKMYIVFTRGINRDVYSKFSVGHFMAVHKVSNLTTSDFLTFYANNPASRYNFSNWNFWYSPILANVSEALSVEDEDIDELPGEHIMAGIQAQEDVKVSSEIIIDSPELYFDEEAYELELKMEKDSKKREREQIKDEKETNKRFKADDESTQSVDENEDADTELDTDPDADIEEEEFDLNTLKLEPHKRTYLKNKLLETQRLLKVDRSRKHSIMKGMLKEDLNIGALSHARFDMCRQVYNNMNIIVSNFDKVLKRFAALQDAVQDSNEQKELENAKTRLLEHQKAAFELNKDIVHQLFIFIDSFYTIYDFYVEPNYEDKLNVFIKTKMQQQLLINSIIIPKFSAFLQKINSKMESNPIQNPHNDVIDLIQDNDDDKKHSEENILKEAMAQKIQYSQKNELLNFNDFKLHVIALFNFEINDVFKNNSGFIIVTLQKSLWDDIKNINYAYAYKKQSRQEGSKSFVGVMHLGDVYEMNNTFEKPVKEWKFWPAVPPSVRTGFKIFAIEVKKVLLFEKPIPAYDASNALMIDNATQLANTQVSGPYTILACQTEIDSKNLISFLKSH